MFGLVPARVGYACSFCSLTSPPKTEDFKLDFFQDSWVCCVAQAVF